MTNDLLGITGGVIVLAVAIGATIAASFASEGRKKPFSETILSETEVNLIRKKLWKYGTFTSLISFIVLVAFGKEIAGFSRHLYGSIFLTSIVSYIPFGYHFNLQLRTRIDAPRPFFAFLGILLLIMLIAAFYISGVRMAEEFYLD